jgi:hypothetical protein
LDTGILFYRKLVAAGVSARLIVSGGTIHMSEILGGIVPDLAKELSERIASFARSA